MKRYDREGDENDTDTDTDAAQFVQAEGDILYRWTDPTQKKVESPRVF